ncbi:hypothetical protein [Emticicia sp. SJ17W-69]|uniref:hypothetical protein n=1 Tax=Emticicia sp. SJ17W-69 TaxID=3421657 RepID=UPI003EB75061
MKKIYFKTTLLVATIIGSLTAQAQKDNVGIGTAKPDQSALLDLSSQTKGLLIPRMSLQQRGTIQNPANGLMIYQTDFLSGFYYFDGKEWKSMASATGVNSIAADPNDWSFTGNAPAAGSFLGTTNAVPLVFKVSNGTGGFISLPAAFNTFLGASTPASSITGIGNTGIGTNTLGALTTSNNNTALGANSQKLSTAAANTSVGSASLFSNTTGESNTAVGASAMFSNVGGSNNVAVGVDALRANTAGVYNMAIGFASLYSNSTGSNNMGIGTESLRFATGSQNTAVGTWAGRGTAAYAGSNNVFIGYSSGSSETGSDKLYISNSSTPTPLVYGDFATKYLAVGEVAAADRAAATSGGYRLLVKGGMITEKIKVAVAGTADWADYVFEPSYKLLSLDKVESFVKENKHLPNVPSAEEMSKNGLDVMQTSAKLMEKIEELTLYMIEMNKEIKALKEENAKLKK